MPPDGGGPFCTGPPQRGKTLIVKRTDLDPENNTELNLNGVSPFIIGKHLKDHVGELRNLKLQRDGSYHIECSTDKQVATLLKLKVLEKDLNVEITEHPTKNFSKNIFTSFELKGLNDDDILSELKKSYRSIEKIKRFMKKVDGNEIPTNTFLVTYNVPNPQAEIKIAFNLIKTRPFYPSPFRCFKCLEFGHPTDNCKKEKKCAKCGNNQHDGNCASELKCVVCKNAHHTLDRNCPAKLKEIQIIKLKIDKNITFKDAKLIIEKENKQDYANALKNTCKTNKNLESSNDKNYEETKKKQDELIQKLNEKIKNLEATVNKLQQELEKATNLINLEKKERKRATKAFDDMVNKAETLEAKLRIATGTSAIMSKKRKEKVESPPRKNKRMIPLIQERTPKSSDDDDDDMEEEQKSLSE